MSLWKSWMCFLSGVCVCVVYVYVCVCVCVYLGCGGLSQAQKKAVEARNRTEGIDEVTILERERQSDRARYRET